ncbi:MAG: aldehyde dehydrogenase family protein [Actinobacteria bacterium]|nr:aldehyde dehydrogenase family protein [Actinomycetota bacterium]
MTSVADALRTSYDKGLTRPLAWRKHQLEQMVKMLEENEAALLSALATDLGKPSVEGFITDIAFVTSEVKLMIKKLKKWNKPERVRTPLVAMPARSRLIPEPLGVVLVIAPWNYPIQLLLVPAAGAIAAGNAVVMKPSEVSAVTSALLGELVPKYMDPSAVAIIEGGIPETTDLLEQRFDHIFYTGNGTVGRVVMTAAVKNLTPVTLELGGKSPVIVDSSANLKVSAHRIAWGKWLNAGQTCVAPDYVLVDEKVRDAFVEELGKAIGEFYGENPQASESYARIVSPRHFDRLKGLLRGTTPAIGGVSDEGTRYISPTVLVDVDLESQVMNEEIFGPILPVISVSSTDDAISYVNAHAHPLALYVFAENKKVVREVLSRTTAGGVTVNGTILHLTNPNLPFGGIGESGMGGYHGRAGVRIFQHMKPVLTRGTKLDPSLTYPPYTARKEKIFRKVL